MGIPLGFFLCSLLMSGNKLAGKTPYIPSSSIFKQDNIYKQSLSEIHIAYQDACLAMTGNTDTVTAAVNQ